MLHRQRVILSMLLDAGGEASHMEVTKWAFLTKFETVNAGGSSFYQFVPYQYGPFSFGLYQEAASLTRDGFIEEASENGWRLTESGRNAARAAEAGAANAARSIVKRFLGKPLKTLVEHVYSRHPWFTINSSLERLEQRPVGRLAVYTAGYEGLLIDGFLNGLLRAGIARMIDVRHNPVARRYGFHKSTLDRLCGKLGIEYFHIPQLGIPSEDRQSLADGGAIERSRLFAAYERTTLKAETRAIESVASLVKQKPSVLVCMEAKSCDCHRSHLASAVAPMANLSVCHLTLAP